MKRTVPLLPITYRKSPRLKEKTEAITQITNLITHLREKTGNLYKRGFTARSLKRGQVLGNI